MLELTPTAAASLASARTQLGLPDHFGVRIFRSVSTNAHTAFEIDFVEGPKEGDQVGDVEPTPFYVAAEVAQPLENAVLDAKETEEGTELILRQRT